jgi:hypothetical protein
MTVDDIQTTEADFETMEAEAPKPKKAAKKAAKTTATAQSKRGTG